MKKNQNESKKNGNVLRESFPKIITISKDKTPEFDIEPQSLSFKKFEDIQDWIERKFYWACFKCPEIVAHLKDMSKQNKNSKNSKSSKEQLQYSFSYTDCFTLHYLESFIEENNIPYIYLANEKNWRTINIFYLNSGFISFDAELLKFKEQLVQLKSDFLKYANSTNNPFKGKINFDVKCSCFVTAVDVDTYCKSFTFKVDVIAWPVVE